MTRVAVYGFGLIGGSLALALRSLARGYHVTAIDRREVLEMPQTLASADAYADVSDADAVSAALEKSDLTVLAAPVGVIAERLPWVLERAHIVTDCGSTKRQISMRAQTSPRARRFVPGHPMAGLPEGGVHNAVATLFCDKNWLLCPEQSDLDAVALVEGIVREVGSRVVHMSIDEHDAAVARTSHLPQLLASALAVMVEASAARDAAGPAFERATLTAGGPAPIWRDIFATNADEIARAIAELCDTLQPVAQELSSGASTALAEALLARARAVRA